MTSPRAHSFRLFNFAAMSLVLTLMTPALAQPVLELGSARLADLQRFQETLADQESEFGPFDPRLLETLSSIERIYIELGDFDEVKATQLRRLQLIRSTEGLENPAVIPVLEELIRTEIALGNWDEVGDHLEHIRNLVSSNSGNESPEMLATMERQASWLRSMVILGRNGDRAENTLDARDLYDDMHNLAEDIYGEESAEVVPWLYKRAYSMYLHVELLNADSSVTTDAIDETLTRDGPGRLQTASRSGFFTPLNATSRVPVTNRGEPVGVAYLRRANGYIDDIRDIAEAAGDWEAWAIASIYHGDFSVMQGRNIGRRDYVDARDKLLELGFAEDRLDAFFNQPMPIPIEKLFNRFEELEAYQNSLVAGFQPQAVDEKDIDDPWDEPVHVGLFTAWEEGLRSTPMPATVDPLLELDLPYEQIELTFRVSSSGSVSGVKALQEDQAERRLRSRTVRAVRSLNFRPALYDERGRSRSHVQMLYQIIKEED